MSEWCLAHPWMTLIVDDDDPRAIRFVRDQLAHFLQSGAAPLQLSEMRRLLCTDGEAVSVSNIEMSQSVREVMVTRAIAHTVSVRGHWTGAVGGDADREIGWATGREGEIVVTITDPAVAAAVLAHGPDALHLSMRLELRPAVKP